MEVAEADGGIVGVGHAGPARDADVGPTTGQLTTLYLAPGSWGAGTGRALHDVALARLVEAGYDSAVVWMLSTNDRARRFYVRQGWGATAPGCSSSAGGWSSTTGCPAAWARTTTSAVPGPTAPGGDGQYLSCPSQ